MVKQTTSLLFRATALLLLAALGLFNSTNAGAIDLTPAERSYLQARENIVFVSQSQYPPFEFVDEHKQHQGMMLDVINWLGIELGFRPIFIDMTFQQAQDAVLAGEADVITSLFISEKRQQNFTFTEPLFDVPASIFINSRRPDIKELDDLNGKIIAIQKGDYAKEFLDSQNIEYTKLDTENFAEAIETVIAEQADAVIGDEQIVLYHIFKHRLRDRIKSISDPLYIGKNCMATNKSNPILVAILNKGIEEARENGVLDKISTKWLGTQYQLHQSTASRYFLPLALISGCLALLSAAIWLWNLNLRSLVAKKTAEIQQRERKLRESESNFRSFFDTVADILLVSDTAGQIVYANPAAISKLGYSAETLLSLNLRDVHASNKQAEVDATIAAISQGQPATCPLPLRHSSGAELPVESRGWRGWWNHQQCVFCLSKDISKEQEALQKFNKLFSNHPTPMLVSNLLDGIITDVNDAFLQSFGFSRADVLGRTTVDLEIFEGSGDYQALVNRLQVDDRVAASSLLLRCKNGKTLDVVYTGERIESQGQQYLLSVLVDESERKRFARELHDHTIQFRAIFDYSLDGIIVIDENGSIHAVNLAACNMLGFSAEELYAGGRDLIIDRSDPRLNAAREECITTGQYLGELRFKRKDGTTFETELSVAIFSWAEDERRSCIMFRDISERRKAADALKQSEEKYRVIFNNEIYAICIFDITTLELLDINEAYCRLYGYSREELLAGMTVLDIATEKSIPGKDMAQALEQGTIFIPLRYHRKKDGTVFPVEIVGGMYVWNGREVMFALAHDITARKTAEDELVEILREKQIILDTANIGITKVVDRKQIWVNQKACDLFGFSREESAGKATVHFYPSEQAYTQFGDDAYPVLAKGQVYDAEQIMLREDGTPLWIRSIGKAIDPSDPSKGSIWLLEDITARKKAEEELKESEQRLNLALQATQDAIWDWNLKKNKLYYSPQWWYQLGYEMPDLANDPSLWRRFVHPEDLERADQLVKMAVQKERSFEIECRLQHKDGHYVPILTRGVITRDEHNVAIRVSGTNTDLTERKLIEQEREQWEWRRQQLEKTESLNRMAGAIAHHFNNILTVIIGNLDMATLDLPPGGPAARVEAAQKAALNAAEMGELMLTYLGQSVLKFEVFDLSGFCRHMLPELAAEMPEGVLIQDEFSQPQLCIKASQQQIKLMIKNLLENACEASIGINDTVGLSVRKVSSEDIPVHHRFPINWQPTNATFAMIEIMDRGNGINEKDFDQIFDPFYSTKFTGRGLGLPVVLGIVRTHDGVITVESGEGNGTIFRVFLPVVNVTGIC